jgi:hypothetical protein
VTPGAIVRGPLLVVVVVVVSVVEVVSVVAVVSVVPVVVVTVVVVSVDATTLADSAPAVKRPRTKRAGKPSRRTAASLALGQVTL